MARCWLMVVLATEARKERRRRNLARQSGPFPRKTPEADRAIIVDLTGTSR